jgi:carbonic anhydrase
MKAVLSLLLAIPSAMSRRSAWDYETEATWSHHFNMCGTNDQSPINVDTSNLIYDSSVCGPTLNWTVDWTQHTFKIGNNGHSIALQALKKVGDTDPDGGLESTVWGDDGTQYMTLGANENCIGKLQNIFAPEGSPHTEFCLHSFHFHWGLEDDEGSEHLVDDIAFPLEVHFVHYSCAHSGLGTTLGQYPTYENISAKMEAHEDYHELAVVGIFFEVTEFDNPGFDRILSADTMEAIQYPGHDEVIVDGVYLQDIIPQEVFDGGYYSYEGSLTTPPCTPIVRWHVSTAHSYIGKTQIARFRQLMTGVENVSMAPNFRDPQYNLHTVYGCMEGSNVSAVSDTAMDAIVIGYAVFISLVMICFGATCYWKSKREVKTVTASASKRERLASRSSMDRGRNHSIPVASPTTTPGAEEHH